METEAPFGSIPPELFRDALEASSVGIVITDRKGSIRWVNPAFTAMTGYASDEVIGKNPRILKSGHHSREFYDELWTTILTGGTWHGEMLNRRKDGVLYSEEQTITPVRGEGGEIQYFIGVKQDISDRRRHETTLQESEERVRSIIENSSAGYFFIDNVGRFQDVNQAWLRMHGYASAGEVVGKHHRLTQTPEDLAAAQAILDEVIQQRQVCAGEFSRLRKDGSIGYHTFTTTPVYRQGEIVGLEGFLIDTTEHRQAEERMRASERRLRSYFESTLVGIGIANVRMEWIEVNDRFCESLGYSRDELCRMNSAAITHPDDRETDEAALARIVEGEIEGYTAEKRYVRKDGGVLHAEISARGVRGSRGEIDCFVVLIRDISERKRLRSELLQSQKLESVGRLAGGIAHDFNNLLTVINGFADLVLGQIGQSHPVCPQIEEIRRAGERAADLTRQLVAFSRKQILQPRVVGINQMIADSKRLLGRLIGDDVELSAILDPGAGLVNVDPGQLNQVLINLAANARQAMPRGGKFTIETAATVLDRAYAEQHPELSPGSYVQIAVSDTGCGMSQEALNHLFEPFYTDREGGTGLGLSTVYGIVKQSGGHIWVYSEQGRGTTFKIYLPRVDESSRVPDVPRPAAGNLSGSETILLAEDHAEVRLLARQALESRGYRVLDAPSGARALEICERHQATIDLLLADVVMSGLSGPDLAARASKLRPGLKVLFMSGYTANAIAHHGVLDAGVELIQKPFSPDALAARVRELLDSQRRSA